MFEYIHLNITKYKGRGGDKLYNNSDVDLCTGFNHSG